MAKKIFSLMGLAFIFFPSCLLHKNKTVTAKDLYKAEGYHLVWADEFENEGVPDPANWKYEKGFVRNEELQWYQPENALCKNGMLIIEARNEQKPNPGYIAGSSDWRKRRKDIQYTSACLITEKLQSWQYGRFEMRGRIDISSGLWPAFWTLGEAGRWPANGEIDIMEYYKGKLLANIACMGSGKSPKWYSQTKPVSGLGGAEWASKFHVWRMDWDEKAISLYVDDLLLNRTELVNLLNQDGTQINPFRQKHYILLNLAMGGINGGPLEGTRFPNRMEVDYVRVYQKNK
jgi:beta-glucanase (GH16 family)